MNQLRFLKLNLCIEATGDYRSKGFVGNKVRGAIGQSMVHLFCPKEEPLCRNCSLNKECIYSNVFKPTRSHPEFTSLPAPFVIGVQELDKEVISKGEVLNFSITLFGETVSYKRQLIEVMKDVFDNAEWGFGKDFILRRIDSAIEKKTIWRPEEYIEDTAQAALWTDRFDKGLESKGNKMEVVIHFKTPLLTKNDMHLNWGFHEFLDAVLYRIASIIDIYEENEFILPYGMLYRRPRIISTAFLKKDKLELLFQGNLSRYLPYLQIGEHLHIGKKATYGFGEYDCQILL